MLSVHPDFIQMIWISSPSKIQLTLVWGFTFPWDLSFYPQPEILHTLSQGQTADRSQMDWKTKTDAKVNSNKFNVELSYGELTFCANIAGLYILFFVNICKGCYRCDCCNVPVLKNNKALLILVVLSKIWILPWNSRMGEAEGVRRKNCKSD